LAHLGSNLALSWSNLAQLGSNLAHLWSNWAQLGSNLAHLGPTWLQLGPILVPTWSNMVPKSDQARNLPVMVITQWALHKVFEGAPVTRPVGVLDPAPPKGCSCVGPLVCCNQIVDYCQTTGSPGRVTGSTD